MELSNKIEGALWYEFDQNNSGGYFERDDFVADVVFIQAMNYDQAGDIMRDMIDKANAWSYCDCCGERWSLWGDVKGFEMPTRYGKDVTKEGLELFSSDGYALFHGLSGRTLKWNGKDTPTELGKLSHGL
jgi:hypothetical protein